METAGEPQEEIVARLLEAFGATPLRVLLTSRKRSKYETSVSLRGLNVTGSREFLRQLGAMLGVPDLGEAPDADLDRIAIGVGGAPLAMRLVVGQMSYGAEIPQILERLRNIKLREGDSDEDDYANFYRSLFLWSWHLLSEPARELLLTLSWFDPFNGASGSRLLESSEIEPGAFIQAVEQLWSLSLLEVDRAGNGSQGSRYFLHSLTQHFAEEFAGG